MGFFQFFKSKPEKPKELSEQSKFDILRDDGLRAMKMGELPYATKCFTEALALREDLAVLSYLAEAQFRMFDFVSALPALAKLHEVEPENLNILQLLARAQGGTGDFAAMEQSCQEALEFIGEGACQTEQRVLFLYYLAEAQAHNGGANAAIEQLTLALTLKPGFVDALCLRAKILMRLGKWEDALADTTALTENGADSAEFFALQAEALAALQNYDEAADYFQKSLEQDPFHRPTILKYSQMLCQNAQWDLALALLNDSIELIPDFAEAYRERSGVKLHLNDEVGAAEDLKNSEELGAQFSNNGETEFSNIENSMNDRYRSLNPYGF